MTTNTTAPIPITLSPANTKFLPPGEDGLLRYALRTGSGTVVLTWPLSLEQTRQGLYRDCIDRICEEQKHIARRIVEEIVSRSLPAFNHWPDAENFTRWAIKRCTSAYYLQAFLTRFFDQVGRIFSRVHESIDYSAVECLTSLCEGDERKPERKPGRPAPSDHKSPARSVTIFWGSLPSIELLKSGGQGCRS
jgi:hypothetical protein